MIRNVRSVTTAALFLALVSACASNSGPAPGPQPEAQPMAAPEQQSAAPAVAPVQVASAEPPAQKEFHPDDMVCRIYDITGTRAVKQRVCKTRAQWIEDARATQAEFRKLQDSDSPQISPAAPTGN